MSKKSQKKTSKTASGSPTPRKSTAKTTAQSKTKSAKTQRAPAGTSRKTTAKAASHNAASKRLKSSESAPSAQTNAKAALSEGQKAPAFRLPRDGGDVATLSDYAGKKLVLFFYPRADTPGCTREAIDFTRLKDAFAAAGTAVLGISADPPKAQEKFRDKHKLGVPLISDERHEMLEAYGAWGEKSMYGKTFQGILRTTVLVGADGRVAKIWRHVRVDGHADAVLAVATNL
ncbi:redoxin domain-containing protein [Bradyrhizobium manausense]|uniref:peroxiredoxin n=1 Tax=Bradyrhizobium TaxID=374 RepID=UPI001BA8BA08|nr:MULTISPECIES: peroxiredoxin [Bradyrhizobium]MBR0828354.1 redoxin domain-containing protein [Bradyrhizobium manausense]UVO25579.1 peroxiredoxin [Bradyrhizobium arachidis]